MHVRLILKNTKQFAWKLTITCTFHYCCCKEWSLVFLFILEWICSFILWLLCSNVLIPNLYTFDITQLSTKAPASPHTESLALDFPSMKWSISYAVSYYLKHILYYHTIIHLNHKFACIELSMNFHCIRYIALFFQFPCHPRSCVTHLYFQVVWNYGKYLLVQLIFWHSEWYFV